MDGSVLVLNSLYQAVQITGVHRAFRLFYAGRARALSPEFVSYDFQLDIPPNAETVVLFHVRALKPGDYMDDLDVCIDGPASCFFEVVRTIVSEQDEG